ILLKQFPDWTLGKLSSTMDLERSFSPVYSRGLLRKGRSGWAVLGVNDNEPQPAIDAALTFGLLWLDHCREREAARLAVQGLRLFIPTGRSGVVRARVAHLDHSIAKFSVCETENDGSIREFDPTDGGNIFTRLVRCPDENSARARFAEAIQQVQAAVPG